MGALLAVHGSQNAGLLAYLGIYAGLHRGHEGAGFCVSDGKSFICEKRPGVLSKMFRERELSNIPGHMALGHTRSATSGACDSVNLQPLLVETQWGKLALVHVGHIINAPELRQALKLQGAVFQSEIDSEAILHLIAHSSRQNLDEAVVESLGKLEGAYSLVILWNGGLIAARDSRGFRPLVYGYLQQGQQVSWLLASETCCLDIVEAKYADEVEPGQIFTVSDGGKPVIWSFAQTP